MFGLRAIQWEIRRIADALYAIRHELLLAREDRMATFDELNTLLVQLTNEVTLVVTNFQAHVATGITAAQGEQLKTQIQGAISSLAAADPGQPS